MTVQWHDEWPTKSGYYWLYGWCWKMEWDRPARLFFVQVKEITNGVVYITNGHFIYKTEGAKGVWLPIEPPELPKEAQNVTP